MVMLKIFRPFNGLIRKKVIGNGQLTKSRYAAHVPQPAVSTSAVEEFIGKNEIGITGNDSKKYRPILTFDETGFPDSVLRALKTKFDAPTVIQSVSWPPVLSGRDLVGIARTGSGKTLSFLLPAIVHISQQEPIKRGDGPIALIMCPTRELAQQVQAVANEWGDMLTKVRTMCAFGGANRGPQEMKLRSGVEIVVATPGRLNDFLRSRVTNMRRCTYLVLDEADRMLDMGFEPQIREVVDRIGKQRQTLMYSATWPEEVRQLAGDFMNDFVHVKIGSAELSANKNITQIVHVTSEMDRDKQFWQLLLEHEPRGKILVFCLQKALTDRLEYQAKSKGLSASAIHGDKSQNMRDRILNDFRSGRIRVLFATEVAARGLDVDDISCVINYDHALCAEDYVHRIGRTARGDLKGESHTFLTEKDAGNSARELIKVLEASDQPVPEELQELASKTIAGRGSVRRWGNQSNFSRNDGYDRSHFSRDRHHSFSDRRHDRMARSRYDDDDESIGRRDYNSRSRYSSFEDLPQRKDTWNRDVQSGGGYSGGIRGGTRK